MFCNTPDTSSRHPGWEPLLHNIEIVFIYVQLPHNIENLYQVSFFGMLFQDFHLKSMIEPTKYSW